MVDQCVYNRSACPSASCGDGVVDADEECDTAVDCDAVTAIVWGILISHLGPHVIVTVSLIQVQGSTGYCAAYHKRGNYLSKQGLSLLPAKFLSE
jgi:hypothetical protein